MVTNFNIKDLEVVEYYDRNVRRDIKNNIRERSGRVTRSEAWKFYRSIKDGDIMTNTEFIDRIFEISKINLKMATFYSVMYLTGSRVGEVLRMPKASSVTPTNPFGSIHDITVPPFQVKHIYLENDEYGMEWLCLKTRVEKLRNRKVFVYKTAYVPYSSDFYTWPLVKIIEAYLDKEFSNAEPDTPIFTFSDEYARQQVVKDLGINLHFIRHVRAKHLVRYDKFSAQDLKKFFGWASYEMPMYYSATEDSIIRSRIAGRL